MVEITKGSLTLTVTKGAYKTIYAPQGWEITTRKIVKENNDFNDVSEKEEVISPEAKTREIEQKIMPNSVNKEEPGEGDTESAIDDDEIDLSEIPLSEMSVPQLKLYGKQLGVEVDTDSAKILRNRIRKSLEG